MTDPLKLAEEIEEHIPHACRMVVNRGDWPLIVAALRYAESAFFCETVEQDKRRREYGLATGRDMDSPIREYVEPCAEPTP